MNRACFAGCGNLLQGMFGYREGRIVCGYKGAGGEVMGGLGGRDSMINKGTENLFG